MELDPRLNMIVENASQTYAMRWMNDAQTMDAIGVYDQAAEMMEPTADGIHLDAGCGFGHMLLAMHVRAIRQNVDMKLCGADISPHMTSSAARFIMDHGIQTALHMNEYRNQEGSPGAPTYIRRTFPYLKKEADGIDLMNVNGRIDVIQDDLRQAEVIKGALGRRKFASASYVFPGMDSSMPYVYPNPVETYEQHKHNAEMMRIGHQIRTAATALLSEKTKYEGQLVLGERFILTDPDLKPDQFIERMVQEKAPNALKYWDIEQYKWLSSNVQFKNEVALGTMQEGKLVMLEELDAPNPGINVALVKLNRKRKRFED